MVDLKCPSCGANISLDETREFGFCSYCGTKVQIVPKVKIIHEGIVNVAGIRTEEQQLISAKKMIELGEFSEAERLLKKIVDISPDYGEAWLELACLPLHSFDITRLLGMNYFGECKIDNTPSQIKERLFNRITNSREYAMAQKILGNNAENIYKELTARCNSAIDNMLSISNKKIQKYLSNFSMLSDYCTFNTDGRTYCFFNYQGEMYLMNYHYYYTLDYKNSNTVHLTLKNFSLRSCATKSILQHISFDIVYIDNQDIIYTTIGTFRKDSAQASQIKDFYINDMNRRRTRHECPICGSELSLFGSCKGKCNSILH